MSILLETGNDLQTGYYSGRKRVLVSGSLPRLQLRAGQLVCLLGPNGSGKSTLLRTLAGLQPALHGKIDIAGADQLTPAALARKISLVLTERVRGSNLTAHALITLGRYPYSDWLGALNREDEAVVEWAIGAAGVGPVRNRKAHTLSDGEYQKVMLARALAQDTPILMLDEPTAHLDLPSRIRLMRLLHELARETGKGILLSTHELDLALQVADEVWLLQGDGRLHRGVPEDLVLDGIFEAAFAKEDIVFDKTNGAFAIYSGQGRPITIIGDGMAAFWTKRALRRAGFVAGASDITVEIVYTEDRIHWQLAGGVRPGSYGSLSDLLTALQE